MRISFHHANPDAGNESFLLRFEDDREETPCVLFDAGHGVDIEQLLRPTDRLVAICLTHAHLDHYASVSTAHREGTPLLTSPATAAMLDDVFDVADTEYDVTTTKAVTESITSIDDWTTVSPGIEIHPVPAGHVPGAVGYLVRVADGDRSHHLLVTGDFTCRRAGGYPGFEAERFVDIDALFLTGATNDQFESDLTDALGTVLEHAHGGAPTMLTTSGLVGVHCAYLLATLVEEFDLWIPIRVVGQVAKLYEALDYDKSAVETVPVFDHTDDCLAPGTIVIAGPEIPIEQSSGRLFGVLKENPSACVVQLVGSGEDPIRHARCTITDYELVNHPSRETLVNVHDTIDPTETIITHFHGGAKGRFNDLSSVVWGSGDRTEHMLFDGDNWRLPKWAGGAPISKDYDRNLQQFASADVLATFSVPSIERHEEPDLAAEGIDMDRISSHLHQGPDAATSPDAPKTDDRPDEEPPPAAAEHKPMTANDSDNIESGQQPANASDGLVRTTDLGLGENVDPDVQAALEEEGLTKEDIAKVLAVRKQAQKIAQSDQQDGEEEIATEGENDQRSEKTEISEDEEEEHDEPATQTPGEETTETDLEDGLDTGATGDKTTSKSASLTNQVGSTSSNTDGESEQATDTDSEIEDDTDQLRFTLHPIAAVLAERIVHEDDDRSGDSTDAVVRDAVDTYVAALLSGEASGGEDERLFLTLDTSSTLEQSLQGIIERDQQFDSTADLVIQGLSSVLESGATDKNEFSCPRPYRRHLDAIARNDQYVFDEPAEVVGAAIVWYSSRR